MISCVVKIGNKFYTKYYEYIYIDDDGFSNKMFDLVDQYIKRHSYWKFFSPMYL